MGVVVAGEANPENPKVEAAGPHGPPCDSPKYSRLLAPHSPRGWREAVVDTGRALGSGNGPAIVGWLVGS
jgi:hypothetical protein